ncbi:alpha-hydroxy acid oxidase [Ralstonia chuxiongensis]|uniref:Alpha-hydroxy-acid oxidizing protein n=1 Tax=Ralstonia chuxiongensis TaxID=2957504 RepID=A0AA41WU98_9RALS|nr:alpha-hydroxy acid oxidase [Ralstonia chuxiongensis]MCP1172557.1 alpha-hydroxy-acid oxidizing protein [Ralstonia chuxiongensis]
MATRPRLDHILSLRDFEPAARRHLPRPVYEYIAGGAEENLAREANRSAFNRYAFVPRVLVDVSSTTTTTELFGQQFAAPFGIAPLGLSALSAYRGDAVLARGALSANIPMVMSGSSLIPLETVAEVNRDAWFQAYLPGEEHQRDALIERVAKAGFHTLVITADTPVAANRENNIRAGFSTPLRPSLRLAWQGITHPRWLCGTFLKTCIRHGLPHFENNYAHRGAPILSKHVLRDFSDRGRIDWGTLDRIRNRWRGRLIVKGILSPNDAKLACALGVDGIIVSNHGGRQLDAAVPPLLVLPQIVEAAGDTTVMMDGGIRRGTDVLKALALGAKFVFVGRSFAYSAALAGEFGVCHAARLLHDEITRNMALLGVTRIADLKPESLVSV